MKRLFVAAAMVALIVSPAWAQLHGVTDESPNGRVGPPPSGLKDGERVDERAYDAAVKRMPAETKKVDPWQSVRDKPAK